MTGIEVLVSLIREISDVRQKEAEGKIAKLNETVHLLGQVDSFSEGSESVPSMLGFDGKEANFSPPFLFPFPLWAKGCEGKN